MAFEKQNFIVVGGGKTGSIGLIFVEQLLDAGVEKIAVFDISDPRDELKVKYPNNKVLFERVDVRDRSNIENAYKKVISAFGYVDVLCNFAGIIHEYRIEDVISINLTGVIYGTMVGIDHMSISKGGRGGMIVNMASICGLDGHHWSPVYCASKHGVVGFTKSMSDPALFTEHGIKFVTICPGFTNTTLLSSVESTLYGQNVATEFPQVVSKYGIQTVDVCVTNMIKALKESENGATWIFSSGEYKLVNTHLYYKS